MKNLTLTISDINRLNSIQKRLSSQKPISKNEKEFLGNLLLSIPKIEILLENKIDLNDTYCVGSFDKQDKIFEKWVKLFENIPGWDYCPFAFLVDNNNLELLHQNVVIVAWFAPSYSYNLVRSAENRAYEVWLKDDGSAIFQLPTLQDAERYSQLYNFKGTWKEAYLLLIETLKKGWPMDEFPEELKPLLKK